MANKNRPNNLLRLVGKREHTPRLDIAFALEVGAAVVALIVATVATLQAAGTASSSIKEDNESETM